ncbi:MAG: MBL fold metallo-hydrolase [Gaiellales bacterium]
MTGDGHTGDQATGEQSASADAAPAALLEIDGLQLGPIGTNCYLVRRSGSTAAFVVDPGAEADRVVATAAERGVTIEAILITHCHWDHIGGVADLVAATGAPIWMSATESTMLEDPDQFPIRGPEPIKPATVDHKLDGDEQFTVAGISIDVLPTPGHSPGHLTFVIDGVRLDAATDGTAGEWAMPPVAFVGDVIFQGSVGRTDLPFSDGATLARSLSLLTERLAPETVLLSGHGGVTTMQDELASNPFLQA